jgi:hypothetical protein
LDGPLSLNYLYGYEAVAGHDDDGVFATKESLTALVEALDGRIQRGGFWHFLFRDAAGALQAVIVDVDGKARQFDAERVGVVSVHDLHGAPRFDTPQAVLDCRRAGADEYLHETGNNYILYVARPVRGVDVEPDWTLFILFASQLDRPGEIEAASCRLDQRSGTIEYVHPDLYALPDEA